MALSGGTPIVVFAFAWLLAGRAVLTASAAESGHIKFADNSIVGQELDAFASCTWPLNPLALGPRFSSPRGGLLVEDTPLLIAVALFFILGALAMYIDICEFAEDTPSDEGKPRPASRSPLPTALAFVMIALALAWKVALDAPMPSPCLRSPLLTARHLPLTALDGSALGELRRLPVLDHFQHPHAIASDAAVAIYLVAFALIGAAAVRADVREMAAEEDRHADKTPNARDPPSSGSSRGSRRSSRRVVLCLVVGAMVLLASLPAREVSRKAVLPAMDTLALEELRSIGLRILNPVRAEAPCLHGHLAPDRVVATVLSVLATVGWFASCLDLDEMKAEEEAAKIKEKKQQVGKNGKKRLQDEKTQERLEPEPCNASAPSPASGPALPMVLRVTRDAATVGNAGLLAWALQRRWLQAGSLASPVLRLPGFARLSSPVASDEVTIVSTGIFVLLGLAAMCVDFHTLASEEDKEEKKTAKEVCATSNEKLSKNASCWQYLTTHWRFVSCVVLLISMFGSAAATLWESTM